MKWVLFVSACFAALVLTLVVPGAMTIEEALKKHTEALMSIPGVVGTGQGLCEGSPCIRVFIIGKTPEIERRIPETLEGHRVEVVVTGRIKAEPKKGK